MKKNKIVIKILIIVMVALLILSGTYIIVQKKYQKNECYDKTEFKIKYSSEEYSIKIPKKMAFEGASGNVVYRFKTLKSRNTLRKEIDELYNSYYKNLEKYNNDGYKLYYDENNNITIGYKIDGFGFPDLLLIISEGIE